jgi:hypothetical protein
METTQGISLCSYLYLKLIKTSCFSFYLIYFSSTKSQNKTVEQVLPSGRGGLAPGGGEGDGKRVRKMNMVQTICT